MLNIYLPSIHSHIKINIHFNLFSKSSCVCIVSECEPEIQATRNGPTEGVTMPPPEFPDFDSFAPEPKESNAMNIAALELEATEFPESGSLPPPPPPDEDGVHFQAPPVQHSPSHVGSQNMWSGEVHTGSLEEKRNGKILSYLQSIAPPEPVSADVGVNGSHAENNSGSEQQLPSESM